MSSIINIETYQLSQPIMAQRAFRRGDGGAASATPRLSEVDTVQFSDMGRSLSTAMAESSYHIARVAAVREEIERGTYETPDRINAAIDRLLDVLG